MELESIQRDKTLHNFNCSSDSPLFVKNQKKLAKPVGNRPLIKHKLNNKNFKSLWDAGSIISLMNKDWLNNEFCNIAIQPVETFIGEGSDISLKAASNAEVNIEGVVTLNLKEQCVQFCGTFYCNKGGTFESNTRF